MPALMSASCQDRCANLFPPRFAVSRGCFYRHTGVSETLGRELPATRGFENNWVFRSGNLFGDWCQLYDMARHPDSTEEDAIL
jgi:hypothetical protein